MSLVKKYFLNSFSYKNVSACSYLFKDNSANCARYYGCLNSANLQSEVFKYKKSEEDGRRTMSILQFARESSFSLSTKLQSLVESMPAYLPFLGRKYRMLGYLWFETLDELNLDDFFTLLELPDTYYSRFQIIELHVWMLLYHLPRDGRINNCIRMGLISAMWEDSEKRAKLVSSLNKNFKRNFKDLHGEFLFSQLFYEYCFSKSDAALCDALWCCFFNREVDNPRLMEALVCYIRYQMHHLNTLNLAELSQKEKKCKIWAPARPVLEEVLNKT